MNRLRQAKMMRWLTGANLGVLTLLAIYIFAVLRAFAAGVETWPAYVLLPIGVVITILATCSSLMQPRWQAKWVSLLTNGLVSAFYLAIFLGLGLLHLHATRRLFLVPANFEGDLYVIHSPSKGPGASWHWRQITYRFPSTGLLQTTDPQPSFFSDTYRLIYPDGHRVSVPDAGPGTLQDTPENRADNIRVVTYFPRSGTTGTELLQCSADQITIGTKAFILSRKRATPMPSLPHPELCRRGAQ